MIDPQPNAPVDLAGIKARLIAAGYPRPGAEPAPLPVRDNSPKGQAARAELRDHIIEDVWALLDELESLRQARS